MVDRWRRGIDHAGVGQVPPHTHNHAIITRESGDEGEALFDFNGIADRIGGGGLRDCLLAGLV